ncbi:hypothetical protein GQ457_04G024480 [Hibiscus cannabinus]
MAPGWLFQKICISFSTWGYAVFAAELLRHGRSNGLRCYLGDMDEVAATSLSLFKHVRYSDEYKDLPAFLFGESMGGAATMLMYFQSKPETWAGLIFSAPLFVMSENMKPSKARLQAHVTLTLQDASLSPAKTMLHFFHFPSSNQVTCVTI